MSKELYGLKILVVDDDQDTRDLLEWVLRRVGAEGATGELARRARYHLGMAYTQQGDFQKAKRELERALALKPDFDGAAEARKTLTTVGGSASQ